ncbi:protein-L-isoaspartate(D-aspartate) O-methyltransferase [Candidatus Micrarchaeota archaeon]|nr:protein-L-isoaspartate(D-aspartate) O-methyltransferase [Candidatus Micrarchaeota archaeon]
MINYLLEHGYADAKVASALRKVPRELFVLNAKEAYVDIPLSIGHGQTISAPSMVATMSRVLDVKDGMKILEVGTGSGWQAAILAELVGKKGGVYTIERLGELVEFARRNIEKLRFKNVRIINADGSEGLVKEAPFDRIIVTAAAPEIPEPLVRQLADNGKLLVPVGSKYWQTLILVEKINGKVERRDLMEVLFVPLIGKHAYGEGLE